jgi:hypothetical protein
MGNPCADFGGYRQFIIGGAVQVDPVKPTSKAPGAKRLKLKYHKLPSMLLQFCFQIQLAPLHIGTLPQLKKLDGRGLHSSTFRLNLSAFCGIGVHLGVV